MRYSLLAPSPGVLTEVAAGTAEAVAAASRLLGETTFPVRSDALAEGSPLLIPRPCDPKSPDPGDDPWEWDSEHPGWHEPSAFFKRRLAEGRVITNGMHNLTPAIDPDPTLLINILNDEEKP